MNLYLKDNLVNFLSSGQSFLVGDPIRRNNGMTVYLKIWLRTTKYPKTRNDKHQRQDMWSIIKHYTQSQGFFSVLSTLTATIETSLCKRFPPFCVFGYSTIPPFHASFRQIGSTFSEVPIEFLSHFIKETDTRGWISLTWKTPLLT